MDGVIGPDQTETTLIYVIDEAGIHECSATQRESCQLIAPTTWGMPYSMSDGRTATRPGEHSAGVQIAFSHPARETQILRPQGAKLPCRPGVLQT